MLCLVLLLLSAAANFSLFSSDAVLYAQDVQKGKASFYAKRFSGTRTSSGERLHHDSLTCAHRTYPFGTHLLVTNPANNRQVIVRVNDRGPFVRGRIIDLSRAAARELGILQQGVATVIVERLAPIQIPLLDKTDIELPDLEIGVPQMPDSIVPVWQTDY